MPKHGLSFYPYFGSIRTPPDLSTIVQDFGGGEDSSYLSRADFDKLRSGEEEEESLEVGLKSWCIVHVVDLPVP